MSHVKLKVCVSALLCADVCLNACITLVLQLQSTGSLTPGTIGKILSGRGVKRGDDISSGGRLSRRNADPIAEAERKAQQEKLYSLDLDRVLAGWFAQTLSQHLQNQVWSVCTILEAVELYSMRSVSILPKGLFVAW